MHTYKKRTAGLVSRTLQMGCFLSLLMCLGCGKEATTRLGQEGTAVDSADELLFKMSKSKLKFLLLRTKDELETTIKDNPSFFDCDKDNNTPLILVTLAPLQYFGPRNNEKAQEDDIKKLIEKVTFLISKMDSDACAHTNNYGKDVFDYAIELKKEGDNVFINLFLQHPTKFYKCLAIWDYASKNKDEELIKKLLDCALKNKSYVAWLYYCGYTSDYLKDFCQALGLSPYDKIGSLTYDKIESLIQECYKRCRLNDLKFFENLCEYIWSHDMTDQKIEKAKNSNSIESLLRSILINKKTEYLAEFLALIYYHASQVGDSKTSSWIMKQYIYQTLKGDSGPDIIQNMEKGTLYYKLAILDSKFNGLLVENSNYFRRFQDSKKGL